MPDQKRLARIAGALYLFVIIFGLFAEVFVRQALRVPGDAAATAILIRNGERLYRLGIVADVLNFVIGIPVVLIIYIIFKKTNKFLVTLAVVLVVIQTAVIATNLLNQISPLLYLGTDPYLSAFTPSQLAALSAQAVALHAQGYGIGLVFFGFYCLIIGYLVWKSARVPRLPGILYGLAGLSYLINSLTMLLSKDFSNPLFPVYASVSFIGELSFCLWLLIKGVKPEPTALEQRDHFYK